MTNNTQGRHNLVTPQYLLAMITLLTVSAFACNDLPLRDESPLATEGVTESWLDEQRNVVGMDQVMTYNGTGERSLILYRLLDARGVDTILMHDKEGGYIRYGAPGSLTAKTLRPKLNDRHTPTTITMGLTGHGSTLSTQVQIPSGVSVEFYVPKGSTLDMGWVPFILRGEWAELESLTGPGSTTFQREIQPSGASINDMRITRFATNRSAEETWLRDAYSGALTAGTPSQKLSELLLKAGIAARRSSKEIVIQCVACRRTSGSQPP